MYGEEFGVVRRIEIRLKTANSDLRLISKLIGSINDMLLHTKGELLSMGIALDEWVGLETWFWEEENGGTLQIASK